MSHAGHQQLTVSTASVGLTPTSPAPTRATVFVEGANVRVRLDGATTNPTSSVGGILRQGFAYVIVGNDIINGVNFIRDDSTDATLDIMYA
jgi:hypothetical protein